MNVNCSCGGRYRRTDIVPVQQEGRTLYADTDATTAHWQCDKCKRMRQQRKRQPGGQSKTVRVDADVLTELQAVAREYKMQFASPNDVLRRVLGLAPKSS